MPFFQNPFFQDFRGNLVLGDRQLSPSFVCPLHAQRGNTEVISVELTTPVDVTGADGDGNNIKDLVINYAIDPNLRDFTAITVDLAAEAIVPAAATLLELVAGFNESDAFSAFFEATQQITTTGANPTGRILIRSKLSAERIKFYVSNTGAETVLQFNARAGVAELPTYFARHTVANRYTYNDSVALLIQLDPSNAGGASAVDDDVIDNAVNGKGDSLGYDSSTVQEDYELLSGRSGIFMFQNICLDGDGNIAQIIEYHAGAVAGDLARKICYLRDGNTNPIQITEEPYTLTADDLVTPDCTDCEEDDPQ